MFLVQTYIPKSPGEFIREEFQNRRNLDQKYSLRNFAQALNIYPGTLSHLLNKKRRVTVNLGHKLAANLQFSPEQIHYFYFCIRMEDEILSNENHLFNHWILPAVLHLRSERKDLTPAEMASRLKVDVHDIFVCLNFIKEKLIK
jgi:plasmid maintenance system antidote protein VapI